jgi:glycosyltransferase involved in cell wall biosynthesis
MDKVLFSASMIVRDEEDYLEGCLSSIRNVVDEIVIVDTGSRDGTKAIAEKFGAKLLDFPWNGNFSDARNEALRNCSGKWILYIDADERLRQTNRAEVEHFLANTGKVAFTVRFHPLTGYTAYREYRIFRNDPRIRFDGVIHETIVPSLRKVAEEEGLEIGTLDITIDHIGYDTDQTRKHIRNLPMLKRQLKRDPKRIYLWWHLGYVLKALGDLEGAESAWESAVEIVRNKKSTDLRESQPHHELIRLRYERGENDSELLAEAELLFPGNYLIKWMKGKILMYEERFEDAVAVFSDLVAIDPEGLEGPLSYDSRIFGEFSYEPLATCYYKLGRYKDSEANYALASECDPENPEYRTKRMFVETLVNES